MVRIEIPVTNPFVEQDIKLDLAPPIPAGDLSWLIPILLSGVKPVPPVVEGETKPPASVPIHPAGVKITLMIQKDPQKGSILNLNVFSCESAGVPVTAETPTNLLGSFQVSLDLVLQNANVPRP
jgi:hypothetical protein